MLEKPAIQDATIISCLQVRFGLHVSQLTFLPLGADVNTAVYRVDTRDQNAYFLKLRSGGFEEITVTLPLSLKDNGIRHIITPLETLAHQPWADLYPYKMILYPFVEGQDGYELSLSDQQWLDFGTALKGIHSIHMPPALMKHCQHEDFSTHWRELVTEFQEQVEHTVFADPTAARLAAFMKTRRAEISHLVERAGQLGSALAERSLDLVLCHADIHPGNLLITQGDAFYIVDWDNPILAPKERDLMFIGGTDLWNGFREKDLFYQGYGPVEIDQAALAYYRYERIVQDIAEFCKQLLLSEDGGPDREQSYGYFTGQFLPHREVAIARQTDRPLLH